MMISPSRKLIAGCIGIFLLGTASTVAGEVRVHGATTVTFGLMKPKQARIEQVSGVKIQILPSSTTRGLADLAQGKTDIAMLAEPLNSAAQSVNGKQPGLVNVDDLIGKHVGDAHIQFIVHPSNPLSRLSKAQLAALFSGQVRNWSEIGGPNQPVLLVGEPTSSPHRMISEALTISYPPDMRIVQNTNQTAVIVMQAPGALSYISTAHDIPERKHLNVIESDVKLPLALYLAYRKRASDDIAKVVAAAEKAAHE